jgi:hypothetical protein
MPIAPVDVGFRGEADTGQRFRYRDFTNTRPQEPAKTADKFGLRGVHGAALFLASVN